MSPGAVHLPLGGMGLAALWQTSEVPLEMWRFPARKMGVPQKWMVYEWDIAQHRQKYDTHTGTRMGTLASCLGKYVTGFPTK